MINERKADGLREVVVFYTEAEPEVGHPSSEETLARQAGSISAVVGFWHQVDQDSCDRLRPFGGADADSVARTARVAERTGTRLGGLFHNLLYGDAALSRRVAETLVNDLRAQSRLIEDIGRTGLARRYAEINIDLEHVPPPMRELFSAFVERLSRRLREIGLETSISVPAKTWDDPQHGWSGAFDYERIGQAVDRVYVMSYDEHGYSSGPGPIASTGWVEDVIAFAISRIPPQKVYVGIPGYGFDWTDGRRPRYLSYAQAVANAERHGASIIRDPESHAPTYTYTYEGERHVVWFEDAQSSAFKLDLANRHNLGGIALWRAGLEDPALWRLIEQKFDVLKLEPHSSLSGRYE